MRDLYIKKKKLYGEIDFFHEREVLVLCRVGLQKKKKSIFLPINGLVTCDTMTYHSVESQRSMLDVLLKPKPILTFH